MSQKLFDLIRSSIVRVIFCLNCGVCTGKMFLLGGSNTKVSLSHIAVLILIHEHTCKWKYKIVKYYINEKWWLICYMILVIRNLWQPCTCLTTAAVNMMMMMLLYFIWLLAPDSTPKTNKHKFVKNRLLLPSYSRRVLQLLWNLPLLDQV